MLYIKGDCLSPDGHSYVNTVLQSLLLMYLLTVLNGPINGNSGSMSEVGELRVGE